MKKIIIVIVCAGMSVGLLVGGVNTRTSGRSISTASQSPSTGITCTVTPCSMDNIITNRIFSFSLNGVEGNHKYTALQSELNFLKAELSKMEKGTQEYNEKISEIHYIFGKISVLLGELSSLIDTQTLSDISQSNTNTIQTDDEYNYIFYMAEKE